MKTKIKEIRKAKGITQKELARRLNIAPSALSQIESDNNNIKSSTLHKIAAALDCSIHDLIGDYLDENINAAINEINKKYTDKLNAAALQLNGRGRKILLDQAETMAKNKDYTGEDLAAQLEAWGFSKELLDNNF